VSEEILHGRCFTFDEVIEELHEVLFTLKSGEVGQGLQSLGHKCQVASRLLIWILCKNVFFNDKISIAFIIFQNIFVITFLYHV